MMAAPFAYLICSNPPEHLQAGIHRLLKPHIQFIKIRALSGTRAVSNKLADWAILPALPVVASRRKSA
jgi:hypothetical protein